MKTLQITSASIWLDFLFKFAKHTFSFSWQKNSTPLFVINQLIIMLSLFFDQQQNWHWSKKKVPMQGNKTEKKGNQKYDRWVFHKDRP